MDLREIQELAYTHAKATGWYEAFDAGSPEEAFPKLLMYLVTELAEAMEDWRKGAPIDEWHFDEQGKPQGIPTELADVVIWTASLAGRYGFDLDVAVQAKMAYNATRPKYHGSVRI